MILLGYPWWAWLALLAGICAFLSLLIGIAAMYVSYQTGRTADDWLRERQVWERFEESFNAPAQEPRRKRPV